VTVIVNVTLAGSEAIAPPAIFCVAVNVVDPVARFVVGVNVHNPFEVTTAVPRVVSLCFTVTVAPTIPVPTIFGFCVSTVLPETGNRNAGEAGGVVEVFTVTVTGILGKESIVPSFCVATKVLLPSDNGVDKVHVHAVPETVAVPSTTPFELVIVTVAPATPVPTMEG
jgi:hypothetical protein